MRIGMNVACMLASLCFPLGAVAAQQNSGFLGNAYEKLQEERSASGQKVKRWISPDVTPGKYHSVMLDKTVLYPQPRSTEQVSSETLSQISTYLDEALRRELAGVVQLATEPGPNTLRLKPAITAVAARDLPLKPYQYLPDALVIKAGKRHQGASLAVEYELQDADTNEVVGAGMREGKGLELKSAKDKLTLAHFRPALDGWAKDARAFVEAARVAK